MSRKRAASGRIMIVGKEKLLPRKAGKKGDIEWNERKDTEFMFYCVTGVMFDGRDLINTDPAKINVMVTEASYKRLKEPHFTNFTGEHNDGGQYRVYTLDGYDVIASNSNNEDEDEDDEFDEGDEE